MGPADCGFHPNQMVEDGRKGREVNEDTGEWMQDTDSGGALVEQDEEAISEADDPVVLELGQTDMEAPAGGRVEEGDLAGISWAYAIAVTEGDPAARTEAGFLQREIAGAGGEGTPVRAHSAEAHVIRHVLRQQLLGDDAGDVRREGGPVGRLGRLPGGLWALAGGESGKGASFTLQSCARHRSWSPPMQRQKGRAFPCEPI